MDAQSLNAFNQARLDAQYAMFGRAVVVSGSSGLACISSVRESKQLGEGGLLPATDFVARLRKSEFPIKPRVDDVFELDGEGCRIAEVYDAAHSSEWRLTIAQLG